MALVSSASVGDKFATGSTTQRPNSPNNGDVRFNTSLTSEAGTRGHIEFYANGWVQLNVRPTPGDGKVGYKAGTGCTVTGNPGTANQSTSSSQKVDIDKNTFVGWYKGTPPTTPIEAHFGLNMDPNAQNINASWNVKSVTRVTDSCDTKRKHNVIEFIDIKAQGKYVCNVGTNKTASCRINRYHGGGNCGLPLVQTDNTVMFHHRTMGLSYTWPNSFQALGYIFN